MPLIRAVGAALGRQRHPPAAVRSTSAPTSTALVVEADGPFPYQVDGDYLGEIDRLELRHVPAALRLVLPA